MFSFEKPNIPPKTRGTFFVLRLLVYFLRLIFTYFPFYTSDVAYLWIHSLSTFYLWHLIFFSFFLPFQIISFDKLTRGNGSYEASLFSIFLFNFLFLLTKKLFSHRITFFLIFIWLVEFFFVENSKCKSLPAGRVFYWSVFLLKKFSDVGVNEIQRWFFGYWKSFSSKSRCWELRILLTRFQKITHVIRYSSLNFEIKHRPWIGRFSSYNFDTPKIRVFIL